MSSEFFVGTEKATFCMTKSLCTITVPGDKAENIVKSTFGGDRFEIDTRKNEVFSIQILTRY